MNVTFVVTHGTRSLDLCSMRLGAHLAVPKLHTDAYERSARRFGVRWLSATAARCAADDARLASRLRRMRTALHLPNQHLARYGRSLGQPFVVTVHDTIRWQDADGDAPALIARPNRRDRAMLGRDARGVRDAAAVIVPSDWVRRQVVERLGLSSERVHVVPWGVDRTIFRPTRRRLFGFPYLLFVGSEQPRKNVGLLLEALSQLVHAGAHRDLRVVKVGGPGADRRWRAETLAGIRRRGLGGRILLVDDLSTADLAAAYAGAACCVLPSLHEGFGLPVLEAMACGCPVVASDRAALPEVAGDAAILVDPRDPARLAEAVMSTFAERSRAELVRRGLRRVAGSTWQATARGTMDVYRGIGASA